MTEKEKKIYKRLRNFYMLLHCAGEVYGEIESDLIDLHAVEIEAKYKSLYGNAEKHSLRSDKTPEYYDNSQGSIYKFSDHHKLNAYEFDLIKRIIRCRKKGLFLKDLEKTKDLIDLYIKEHTDVKI